MAFDNFRGRAMSVETVAEEVDSCASQVYRWIAEGKIKAAKLGVRMTRVDGDSLADFLTTRLNEPRPPRGKRAKAKSTELAGQA